MFDNAQDVDPLGLKTFFHNMIGRIQFMTMRFYDFVAKTLATHTSLQLAAEMNSNFRRGRLPC